MDTFSNRWPGKYRVFLDESSEIFITRLGKMLSFATSWQLFEATYFNGSLDLQYGPCSGNCERQMRSKNFITCSLFFKHVYHCSSFLKKCFYRSTGIMARMSSLLILLLPGIVADMWFRCRPRVCVFSPTMMAHGTRLMTKIHDCYLIVGK